MTLKSRRSRGLSVSTSVAFGQRREPHTIIIAKGKHVRHFTVRPWVFAVFGSLAAAGLVGYFVATSYLIMRDDLLSATMARQARLQHVYEDRIAALRSQVDRITSHRLLDQQVMETKIAELVNRQSVLAERAGILAPVLDRVSSEGLVPSQQSSVINGIPLPAPRPGTEVQKAELDVFEAPVGASAYAAIDPVVTASIPGALPMAQGAPANGLMAVGERLASLEADQVNQIALLRSAAQARKMELVSLAQRQGLSVQPADVELTGTGGPLLPEQPDVSPFEQEIEALNATLDSLDATRERVRAYPIAHPAPGKAITSRFGNRRDPILGRGAFHAGIDFRAPTGTNIRASAPGTVVKAGRNGGYGKMVEIRHANGLTTRYAHLSRISVKKGDSVPAGAVIGQSGNTGRSTGPHLHYEVRQSGKAIDPLTFIRAGNALADHL